MHKKLVLSSKSYNGKKIGVYGSVLQKDMFGLNRVLEPLALRIATTLELKQILNTGTTYFDLPNILPWSRTDEYVAYRKDRSELGSEIIWTSGRTGMEIRCVLKIPDIPINLKGNQISLQKIIGSVVFRSTSLLSFIQKDEREFLIEPNVDLLNQNNVRLINLGGQISKNNSCELEKRREFYDTPVGFLDDWGLPDADRPYRYDGRLSEMTYGSVLLRPYSGQMRDLFEYIFRSGDTGWHGNLGMGNGASNHPDFQRLSLHLDATGILYDDYDKDTVIGCAGWKSASSVVVLAK